MSDKSSGRGNRAQDQAKPPAKILFQQYFKSVGPRTYAAQLKEAGNGNHYLVLTEGKRDPESEQVRKTKLFVFSEDFSAFFHLLHETAVFIRKNPVSEKVRRRRETYWRKQGQQAEASVPKPKASASRPTKNF